MRKKDSTTSGVLVLLLLCVTSTAAVTTRAQTGTRTGAKQSGTKGKAAPKAGSELDDDLSPRTKAKPLGRAGAVNNRTAAADDISDPSDPGTPEADSASENTPATRTRAPVTSPSIATSEGAKKKADVTRLCLAVPRVQMNAGDAAQAAEAVSHTFKSYLTSSTLETVVLGARLPSQAAEEAKQGGCDYVLYSSLTHKKGGSGLLGRALGDAANSAVWHIPGGGSAAGTIARSAAISGAHTAASVAASIKAKDELTLAYKLETADGTKPPLIKTEKAKAKANGEDVLTPLIEKASEMIINVMRK